ncbi:hypothetical protein [Halorussus aquaticus]|uniref:Uncharacterized protein n=1 Tax=Halorussus aquaticus TaxID=2953748 RepID=A0ABD5Q1C7_9EURY|nr:hypothetical protein [Halorussus aquaticus]
MSLGSDRFTDLLLGEKWSRTRQAFILAVGFAIVGVVLEYALFLTKFEGGVIETLHEVFLLDGYLPSWHATGMLFVIGLAALHAYLNEGYLPSILLGWSPVYGNVSWTIGSPTAIENYYLDPVAAFERTFPEALVLASLGFVIGLSLRWIRKRRETDAMPQSDSDNLQSTG